MEEDRRLPLPENVCKMQTRPARKFHPGVFRCARGKCRKFIRKTRRRSPRPIISFNTDISCNTRPGAKRSRTTPAFFLSRAISCAWFNARLMSARLSAARCDNRERLRRFRPHHLSSQQPQFTKITRCKRKFQ